MTHDAEVADYVVVGAGSAGCVLADRLSAAGDASVLVIEAGQFEHRAEISVPAAYPRLFGTPVDWGFHTTAQPGLGGRGIAWPRGRAVGGSSTMNAQIWTRGHRSDYDGWVAAGCAGWSYEDVLPYFRRAERWISPEPATGADLRRFGADGPVWISGLRERSPATAAFLAACAQAGLRELNDADAAPEGFGPVRVTQRNGRRWSASDAYLRPALGRPNLRVLTGAKTSRLTFEGNDVTGVEFQTEDGPRRALARREVILSAGAVGSPWLLLSSGIGDGAQLSRLGVRVRVHRPDVGGNLADHVYVPVSARSPIDVSPGVGDQRAHAERYLRQRRGPLTSNLAEALAFVRTLPGIGAADIELLWLVVAQLEEQAHHGVTVASVLLQPASRGRIRLNPADRLGEPLIDAGYFSDQAGSDLQTMARGVRWALRVASQPAMSRWIASPPTANVSDDDVVALCRNTAQTLYHPVGTCRMGGDADAVLDCELRVRGVGRLRVVDASVLPTIPRGHTHAPTVMVAERAADLILTGTSLPGDEREFADA